MGLADTCRVLLTLVGMKKLKRLDSFYHVGHSQKGPNDPVHYLMILLVHDLKFARPERTEFFDPGLGGVQVRGGFNPNRRLVPVFSYDVVMSPLHGTSLWSPL